MRIEGSREDAGFGAVGEDGFSISGDEVVEVGLGFAVDP